MSVLRRTFEILCACYFLASSMGPATAATEEECSTLSVAAARIPHYIENRTTGIFIELLTEATKYAGLDLKVSVLPKKRALQQFLRGHFNALIPHSSAGQKLDAYKSVPILIKRDFAFVRRGSSPPKTIEDMVGLRVGLTSQYAYPKSLTEREDINFTSQARSDQMNIRMLLAGRYDVAIIEQKSGLEAASSVGREQIIYDPRHPISELKVWIQYEKTACGQFYKQKIDQAISEMKADGNWRDLFRQLP